MTAKKTTSEIRIDGVLDEAIWSESQKAKDFFLKFPVDTAFAKSDTEVMIAFDQNNIYVAAVMHRAVQGEYIVTSLKRDFSWTRNDNFSVYFDTFYDGQNAITFAVNAYGVQREGLLFNTRNLDLGWDSKWFSAVTTAKDRWVAEMKIPLRILRYQANGKNWRINFSRNDLASTERSSWVPTPINYLIGSTVLMGDLEFEIPIHKVSNLAVIPYVLGKANTDTNSTESEGAVGGDIKLGITSSLNLDLTVNPDFSQVELDQQVINLDRFEIFFPERRQFFLENADLFSEFGFRRIRPFFSRRIGIVKDATTGINVQAPIWFGARLSGKLNNKWRIGLLSTQTGKIGDTPSQNYTVAAVQHKVLAKSNIAAFAVNRQIFDEQAQQQKYTRIVGADFNLLSEDGTWWGKTFLHKAFIPNINDKDFSHGFFLGYITRNVEIYYNHEYIGENFNINDVGFVLRRGFYRLEPFGQLSLFPKKSTGISKKIIKHTFEPYANVYYDSDFNRTDTNLKFTYSLFLKNTSVIGLYVEDNFIKILNANGFDPSLSNAGVRLSQNTNAFFSRVGLTYSSDNRRRINGKFDLSTGGYFNAVRDRISATLNYRFQPYGSIGLNTDYNIIKFPTEQEALGFKDVNVLLLGMRLDVSFTKSLFLTYFTQYNEQQDNFNQNIRLQWRFRPVSDFFIVYTQNYAPNSVFEQSGFKNSSLVFKLTYWLNL